TIIAKYFSEISGKTMTIENFRKSLIDVGNTPFVKWRYIYEQKNINHMDINLLATIANALGLAGMELLKEEDS
ncbi:MAG TPA: hypothetical protein P5239_08465, partial [Victivallales bacterium]|nr:hypothetical protein [Victivallales bacterium]